MRIGLAALALLVGLLCNESDPVGPHASVAIRNESSSWTVTGVFMTPVSSTSGWGLNHLTTALPPDEQRTIELEPDTYDVKIESDHPHSPLQVYAVEVHDGDRYVGLITEERMEFIH